MRARTVDTPRYWYTAKRFGIGWRTALTWEGWTIDLALFALFVAAAPWFRSMQRPFLALTLLFGPLLARAAVAHFKGEPGG